MSPVHVEPWRVEAVALVMRSGMTHDGSELDQAVDDDAERALLASGYPAENERLREALRKIADANSGHWGWIAHKALHPERKSDPPREAA